MTMTDPQPPEDGDEFTEPSLDLDAMLKTLHDEFSEPDEDETPPVAGEAPNTPPATEAEPVIDPGPDTGDSDGPEGSTSPAVGLPVIPPGMVDFNGEVIPEQEARALIELNRRMKIDPSIAQRVTHALLPPSAPAAPAEPVVDPNALPEWIDPDDPAAVNLFRQNQDTQRQVAEWRQEAEVRRQAEEAQAAQNRQQQVISAFRSSMTRFHTAHPTLSTEDLTKISDTAANLGLFDSLERPAGSLEAGIDQALEMTLWGNPQYRDLVVAGGTVPTNSETESEKRKHKSSALSGSTGSTSRAKPQSTAPASRDELIKQMTDSFRDGLVNE